MYWKYFKWLVRQVTDVRSTWWCKHCPENTNSPFISILIKSLLMISGRMSLKQSNEQVDYIFYLLMAPFSWNMARQQHVKCLQLIGRAMTWPRLVLLTVFLPHDVACCQAPPSGERVATTLQKISKCIENISKVYRKYSIQFISTFGRNIKLSLQELGHTAIF